MIDERAFIRRVELADTEELADLLARPTLEEEKALRAYLGDDRFQRMHGLAVKSSVTRSARDRMLRSQKRNVVVIHGIMGSELTAIDRGGARDHIWVKALRILLGALDRLRLNDDGLAEFHADFDVRATGMMKRCYGELLLSLAQRWNVRAFWFDWRKDLNIAADELKAQISGWFAPEDPVHIVAHSMGGLVARTFIKNHPERWQQMTRDRENSTPGGRLIMLGTPNHGSFAIPQVIVGLEKIVRWLTLADTRHSRAEVLTIFNSFVGTYQMLPSPLVMKEMKPLYDAKTYGELNVPQRHLDNARKHHDWLEDAVDDRMIYVAGYNQPTFSNITDFKRLNDIHAYGVTALGDGRVPHDLGRLTRPDGEGQILTYYVDEVHGSLPSNALILAALDDLLTQGQTSILPQELPTGARGEPQPMSDERAREQLLAEKQEEEKRLQSLVERIKARANAARSLHTWATQATPVAAATPADTTTVAVATDPAAEATTPLRVSPDERQLEELVTGDFLGTSGKGQDRHTQSPAPFGPVTVRIRVVRGSIDQTDALQLDGEPIDAIAVGHYIGVKPQAAELALDRAISRPLRTPKNESKTDGSDDKMPDSELLLSQYTERGTLRGELGQPFFLHDPRQNQPGRGETSRRVIAIAGMGVPGRFGTPELTVLARELCWSLGRMSKQHLATVLIGAGNGNLQEREAISAWLRGIRNAVTGSFEEERRHLAQITFVERNPGKIRGMQEGILAETERLERQGRLRIEYTRFSDEELLKLDAEGLKEAHEGELKRLQERSAASGSKRPIDLAPTRITITLEANRKAYRFGAITDAASIPEREITLDPALVVRANDELAAESDPEMQFERGRFLEGLLVPADLRAVLYTDAPLVMLLDATTARVHWEMVAQSELGAAPGAGQATDGRRYLGTSRGFTRQLRTLFAPPPEPPPPPRRVMRVLVVADPAIDAPLPGAEAEGVEVADLFESFNQIHGRLTPNRVEVVRLFGPSEATRTNVLRHLMVRSYDVVHFAGHCMYDTQNPAASGWIFSRGERLTAHELTRIDRVPKFVFSNACESGITPDRPEERTVDLAPSFAEAFFARGVANFVCTAWPVDDAAARLFAHTLYSGLLALGQRAEGAGRPSPKAMYEAIRDARLAIADTPNGARTWGAYQHYGNPYMRFFYPETFYWEPQERSSSSSDGEVRGDTGAPAPGDGGPVTGDKAGRESEGKAKERLEAPAGRQRGKRSGG